MIVFRVQKVKQRDFIVVLDDKRLVCKQAKHYWKYFIFNFGLIDQADSNQTAVFLSKTAPTAFEFHKSLNLMIEQFQIREKSN